MPPAALLNRYSRNGRVTSPRNSSPEDGITRRGEPPRFSSCHHGSTKTVVWEEACKRATRYTKITLRKPADLETRSSFSSATSNTLFFAYFCETCFQHTIHRIFPSTKGRFVVEASLFLNLEIERKIEYVIGWIKSIIGLLYNLFKKIVIIINIENINFEI